MRQTGRLVLFEFFYFNRSLEITAPHQRILKIKTETLDFRLSCIYVHCCVSNLESFRKERISFKKSRCEFFHNSSNNKPLLSINTAHDEILEPQILFSSSKVGKEEGV